MSRPNAVAGQPGRSPPASQAQKHRADNLNEQLGVIMVQMGRILKAQVSDQDRADFIVEHARKKMIEATDSFHSTLDDMEIEITRAKAVLLRDLEVLQGKHQPSQAPSIQAQVAPPAPMVLDLGALRPHGPAVPVAPMMGTGGASFVAAHGIPKTEAQPVAPFPDMGGPINPPPKPVAAIPFAKVKASPVDQKRPSPKQTKQPTPKQPTPKPAHKPTPKSNPASGRMANKPNPMASVHKQAPKPPATAPPAAPAVAPAPMAVAPAAPMAPLAAHPAPAPPQQPLPPQPPVNPVPHFTNATFTLGPTQNEPPMQSAGGDINMDMPGMDLDSFGTGASGDAGSNDTTMDDLDHFFDMGGGDNTNADAGTSDFNQMDEYMNSDFDFETFN